MRALLTATLVLGLASAAMAQTAELKVGDQAPNFKLQATDGKTYQLSDFKGKKPVVVAWFPAAFTRGCTIECKSLAENGDKIKMYDVTYFMASVDPIEKNTEFAKAKSVTLGQGANAQVVEKKEADFPLLSDPTKETAKAYGVLNERGVANRWTFYIDKNGKISYIEKMVKPETSAEDMIAKLSDLKVGDQAPNFKLQATDGKTYQLSDFKGKKPVVLAWFPAAFTRGCTIECKSLAENGDKIKMYDVAYFMASVDPIEKNTEFAKAKSVTLGQGANAQVVEKKEADFPLLSDPTKDTAKAYGVLNDRGVANRWTFYIDKNGKISYIEKTVKPATSAEDMVAKLAELKVPMNHK